MNIGSATSTALDALTSTDNVQSTRASLQVALLKKTLISQQEQSAELLKIMEGKGQTIDFRA
ncbi:MAG: hypothetical protein ABL949_05855 [Fimbriimonadaceae bacterium]